MSLTIESQIKFYDWQLQETDMEWAKYHGSNILDLYTKNTLFIGKIWGYDEKRGILILRFKKGKFPRLNIPLTLSYPKSSVGLVKSWNFTYGKFREFYVEQFTNCVPIYYLENKLNENYRYVGVKNVSLDFLQHIKIDLYNKTNSVIVLGEEDPPREYLVALRKFTIQNPSNPILGMSSKSLELWKPKPLDNEDTIVSETIKIIDNNKGTIIQGPPGTGKTYLSAKLCDYYLKFGLRICITALTHKALTEAASKDGLQNYLKERRVLKTNLSASETALLPALISHDITQPLPKGKLLLSTYYSLSKLLEEVQTRRKCFDLLIIEEASQAFLTTIAGFSELSDKVVIVGDFMQLQPIVKNERNAINIHKDIGTLINGLRTFSLNKNQDSYRLVNTYRLTKKSANQSGVFYDGELISKSKFKNHLVNHKNNELFCPEGGTSILNIEGMDEGKTPSNAIKLMVEIIENIRVNNPTFKIAILSPYKKTVNSIIDSILDMNLNFNNLEVNTVDRIQGAEVDICLFLIPSVNPKFVLQENRFNVATSRAKRGTLIIMEKSISLPFVITNRVNEYLKSCYLFNKKNSYNGI
jgi:superfamily I DNA and/or RNA helicase